MGRKHGPWTIRSSECLHRDEFVEVWRDEVLKPDGEAGRYALQVDGARRGALMVGGEPGP